jgi:exo-1,4-beta-D-glucosaminidase
MRAAPLKSLAPQTSVAVLLVSFLAATALALPFSESTTALKSGWRLASSWNVVQDGSLISQVSYDAAKWLPIPAMPATVLEILQEDGVYPNLYFGKNLTETVPRDLFRQDWWYRTTFTVPTGHEVHWLVLEGINYRAEVWINGTRVSDNRQVAGMYNSFEFNITKQVKAGRENVLAVRVTPEQAFEDIDGVELADSWFDWINSKYLGFRLPDQQIGISYVPDRNAGVWKQVYLRNTGAVELENPYVKSSFPESPTNKAALTVYCDVKNGSSEHVAGVLSGEITRAGKPPVRFEQQVTLGPDQAREIALSPETFHDLLITNPDLWWPYQWGAASLYHLKLDFKIRDRRSDSLETDFGIRKVTQHRDSDHQFSDLGPDGNFYLRVNDNNYLIRGADYTPDLLYRYDEAREQSLIEYVKDLGINMLRWESKISSEHILDIADREGVPVMLGWMCCNQWEKWSQWDAEDHRVALESLRAQIRILRRHPSVVLWANGSDGLPPEEIRNQYHQVLSDLHWQSGIVDTVSAFNKDSSGNKVWDGIRMEGPYSWRPPAYWFSDRYKGTSGSVAEQGDNESIPPYESLKKFIPADRLWPINDWWFYHAGSTEGNNTLANIKLAVDRRYGPSQSAQEFAEKAQLAHYENTRAQFEAFAAAGWSNHKMTMYWMLNSHWPSFFGHIIDYYLKPGGAYYGAKKGLQPINIVYDYYASGDRSSANIYLVNQKLTKLSSAQASVEFINLDGSIMFSREQRGIQVDPLSSVRIMQVPRVSGLTSAFFVRCRLSDESGHVLANNVYWQSTANDDVGPAENDNAFRLQQVSWADLMALKQMEKAEVQIAGNMREADDETTATVTLTNKSKVPAFFVRVEIAKAAGGEEVLPIVWTDNYVTLFAGESASLQARLHGRIGDRAVVRIHGYNVPGNEEPLQAR